MDQDKLQKLLDSLDEGPLGQKKQWQWDRVFIAKDISSRRTKEEWEAIAKKIEAKTDFKERSAKVDWKKKVENTDYEAIAAKIDYAKRMVDHKEAYTRAAIKRRKPILAFKVEVEKRGGPFISKEFIGQYDFAYDAAIALNLYQADIANVLRPKSKCRITKGYTFEYLEE